MLRIAEGLKRHDLLNAKGMLENSFHLGLLFEAGESYPARMPLWLQRGILVPRVAIARWRGVDRALAAYLPSHLAAPIPGVSLAVRAAQIRAAERKRAARAPKDAGRGLLRSVDLTSAWLWRRGRYAG